MPDKVTPSPVDERWVVRSLAAIAAAGGGQTGEPGQGPLGQINEMTDSFLFELANEDDAEQMRIRIHNALAAFVTIGSALTSIAAGASETDRAAILLLVDEHCADLRDKLAFA